MAMNNNVGALFDLDGVIVDTEGIYTDFGMRSALLYILLELTILHIS